MCSEKELSSNLFIFSEANHFLTFFQRGITNRQVVSTTCISHLFWNICLIYTWNTHVFVLRVILCFLSTFVYIFSFYSTSYILTSSRFHIYIAIYFHSIFCWLRFIATRHIRLYFMLWFGSLHLCSFTSSRICGIFVYSHHRGFRVSSCIYSSWRFSSMGLCNTLSVFLYIMEI